MLRFFENKEVLVFSQVRGRLQAESGFFHLHNHLRGTYLSPHSPCKSGLNVGYGNLCSIMQEGVHLL